MGPTLELRTYRLMQLTLRDVLEQKLGADAADDLFRQAGHLSGLALHARVFQIPAGLTEEAAMADFVQQLSAALADLKVGILRVEETNVAERRFIITISEDLDCSGLPDTGEQTCVYDEGFLAGILEGHFKQPFCVQEVDCWSSGDRTCRFEAFPVGSALQSSGS